MSEQTTLPTPMSFEYVYSNGERIFKKEFTIDEILAGDPVNILLQSKMLEGFKIIAERQFTGKTLLSGQRVFANDVLKIVSPADNGEVNEYTSEVVFVAEASAFLVSTKSQNDCFLGIISDSPLAMERSYIELLGNTIENPDLIAKQPQADTETETESK